MFVNINVHSYYTLLDSLLSIDDIVRFAVEHKMSYAALTDINNLSAAWNFFCECRKNKIKPIIGLEVVFEGSCYVFIAKNNSGYLELVRLSSQLLCNDVDGLSFKFTNNQNVFAIHKNGKRLGLGCEVYTFDQTQPNRVAAHTAKLLSKNDSHFLNVLTAIQKGILLSQLKNNFSFSHDYSLWNEQQAVNFFDQVALNNLAELVNKCQLDLSLIHAPKLYFPFTPEKLTPVDFLTELCFKGLSEKGINLSNCVNENYYQRLLYEIGVLKRFNFVDYFLIVWDLIKYAHSRSILIGPGRGSAAGSLVAYALKITAIDPIKNNLMFERFLNPERISMPDIDIDVSDVRREELFNYLRERYGKKNVALITIFQRIQAKMAIRDAGRILKINSREIDEINKLIPSDDRPFLEIVSSNSQLMEKSNEFPELFHIANKLVGLPRQIGVHAAGVVVSHQPLENFIPVMTNQNNYIQTQSSYSSLEDCGLVKIDILGLRNLSVVADVLTRTSHKSSWNFLSQIPWNDYLTMKALAKGLTFGIFQLESSPMTKLIKRLKPKTIDQIATVISLYRPGPMSNIELFIRNSENPSNIKYIDNQLSDILSLTNGIIVYQEQIIEIVKRVANFSNAKADIFRRAISKKETQIIQNMKSEFIQQGLGNNFTDSALENIYNYIAKFADYGFNYSHAFSYALLSYWMAYIKVHYSLVYFCSLFNHGAAANNFQDKQLQELDYFKIRFLLPSINKSIDQMEVENSAIRIGLNLIKGVSSVTVKKILRKRSQLPNGCFTDLKEVILSFLNMKIDLNTVNRLIFSGVFNEFKISKTKCQYFFNEAYNSSVKTYANKNVVETVFSARKEIKNRDENFVDKQTELLGINHNLIVDEAKC